MFIFIQNHTKGMVVSFFVVMQFLLLSLAAKAEGYCVACYSPDVVYQCLIEGSKNTSSLDPRHQILCIKLIAKDGGHARCSVERFTLEGCKGKIRYIDADTSTLKSPKDDTQVAGSEGEGTASETKSPPKEGLDKNSEIAKEVAADEIPSQEQSESAGNATEQAPKNGFAAVAGIIKETTVKTGEKILSFANTLGHATKKTWKCVTTFLSDC